MTKPNALAAFINEAEAAPSPVPEKVAKPKADKPAKAKPESTGKSFPFRLSDDDHRALKMLAVRDGMSMQSMIFEAVKAHASERGVKLKG